MKARFHHEIIIIINKFSLLLVNILQFSFATEFKIKKENCDLYLISQFRIFMKKVRIVKLIKMYPFLKKCYYIYVVEHCVKNRKGGGSIPGNT